MLRRPSGHNRGYTLMEVIVATAVGMVVVLMIGTFIVLGIRSHADAIEQDRASADRRATIALISNQLTQAELPLREALDHRVVWRLDDGSGKPFHMLWLDNANPARTVLRYSVSGAAFPTANDPSDGVIIARLATQDPLEIEYLDGDGDVIALGPNANQSERRTQTRRLRLTYLPAGEGAPVTLQTGIGMDGPMAPGSTFPNGDFSEAGDGKPLAHWAATPASALSRVTEDDDVPFAKSASLAPSTAEMSAHLDSDYFLAKGDTLTLRVFAATAASVCRIQLLDAGGNPLVQRSPTPTPGRWVTENVPTVDIEGQAVRLRLVAQGGPCRFAGVASLGIQPPSSSSAYSTLVLNQEPAAYWRLGDGPGAPAADATGAGNNGTYLAGATPNQTSLIAGDLDPSVRFIDGVVHAPDVAGEANTVTVDAWVKVDGATSSWRGIIVRQGRWGLLTAEGQLAVYDFATGQMRGAGAYINDGKAHHVALVWRNGVSSGSEVYLDGQRIMTTTLTSTTHTADVAIGSGFATGAGQNFHGFIDEVSIVERALGADEIRRRWDLGRETLDYAALVKSQPGLVGHWRLGDRTGIIARDASGHARDGSYMHGAYSVAPRLGQLGLLANDPDTSLLLDGTDGGDHVRLPANAAFNGGGGTMSTDAWIQTCNAGTDHRGIIIKQHAYGLFLLNGVLVTYDWSGGGNRSTGVNLSDCKRHHVALTTRSGVTNGTKVYIDGAERLTTTVAFAANTTATIGAGNPTGSGQNFAGRIDEVTIHDTILTPAQIKARWDAGK